jgi:hypothetical protein
MNGPLNLVDLNVIRSLNSHDTSIGLPCWNWQSELLQSIDRLEKEKYIKIFFNEDGNPSYIKLKLKGLFVIYAHRDYFSHRNYR